MKHLVLITALFIITPVAVLHARDRDISRETHNEQQQDLWLGIVEKNPVLVKRAIKNGVDLTATRGGNYEDPPFTAALRAYGNLLMERTTGMDSTRGIGKRILAASTGSILLAVGAYLLTENATASLYSFMFSFTTLFALSRVVRGQSAEAKIVELLLNAQGIDFSTRNREGLDAIEVFSSYYQFAYELQDPLWFNIMDFLIKNSESADISYNVIDDIATDLQALGSPRSM